MHHILVHAIIYCCEPQYTIGIQVPDSHIEALNGVELQWLNQLQSSGYQKIHMFEMFLQYEAVSCVRGCALALTLSQSDRPRCVHGLGPVGHLELGEDVGDMVAHSLGA